MQRNLIAGCTFGLPVTKPTTLSLGSQSERSRHDESKRALDAEMGARRGDSAITRRPVSSRAL